MGGLCNPPNDKNEFQDISYPAGVDADDVDDVEESRHFGVVLFAVGWLLAGLLGVASGELFSEGLADDEAVPRYLGRGKPFHTFFLGAGY